MDLPIPDTLTPLDTQIVEFLASGTPATETASLCGLTLPDIQDKMKLLRPYILERGKALRAERVEAKYSETEEKILNRIKREAEDDLAEVGPLIRALEIIAKNRILYKNPLGYGAQPNAQPVNAVININLPAGASIAPSVTLNSQGEIIAVGERNMASLPIQGVQEIFSKFDKTKEAQGVTHEHTAQAA